ncbi:hypothetical protein DB347_02560 [Opitutaceae bacterium EW11]|nr:hypothetical protein DB347_02560 [Opitutaceae bacterium EW11]
MNFPDFFRIEREGKGRSSHYIVHTRDPKFSMEIVPDRDAPDKIGRGVIKRLCIPNSCLGDYTKYSEFVATAQDFFRQSFSEPAPKAETKRICT